MKHKEPELDVSSGQGSHGVACALSITAIVYVIIFFIIEIASIL